jgi:hypothetical protein
MRTILSYLLFSYLACSAALAQTAVSSKPNFFNPNDKPIYFQYVASAEELKKIEHKHDRFLQQNLGHFSNREAVEQIEGEREAQFIVIPIFQKQRAGEFWIYIEYFLPAMVEQPIEQRIQHYIRKDRYTYQIKTYHLKDAAQYVNEWKKTIPFENFITKDGLNHDEFCDMLVTSDESKEHYHKAAPIGTDCPLQGDLGMAKYSVTSFDVSDDGYLMCIEFLDADKQKIKNCPDGGTLFKRMDYNDRDYVSLAPPPVATKGTTKVTTTPKEKTPKVKKIKTPKPAKVKAAKK